MKEEISIPKNVPDISEEELRREEDLKAAAKRRDAYSAVRDVQAKEQNEAIARRLAREKEEPPEGSE